MGWGAAELSGRLLPLRQSVKGATDQARGRGVGGGEDNLDISFFLSLFICVIQSPPRVGWGAAELSGRSRPMRRRSKGARTTRREDGGWVGERIIWIFLFSCPCSLILSTMVQYSVSNKTKRSHTDHIRCSVMLFPYAPFDMLLNVFSYILFYSIRYSPFILQSAFTQIWLDLEIRLRYYCTAIFQTTKTARINRTMTVTVTPVMNPSCAFFPIS